MNKNSIPVLNPFVFYGDKTENYYTEPNEQSIRYDPMINISTVHGSGNNMFRKEHTMLANAGRPYSQQPILLIGNSTTYEDSGNSNGYGNGIVIGAGENLAYWKKLPYPLSQESGNTYDINIGEQLILGSDQSVFIYSNLQNVATSDEQYGTAQYARAIKFDSKGILHQFTHKARLNDIPVTEEKYKEQIKYTDWKIQYNKNGDSINLVDVSGKTTLDTLSVKEIEIPIISRQKKTSTEKQTYNTPFVKKAETDQVFTSLLNQDITIEVKNAYNLETSIDNIKISVSYGSLSEDPFPRITNLEIKGNQICFHVHAFSTSEITPIPDPDEDPQQVWTISCTCSYIYTKTFVSYPEEPASKGLFGQGGVLNDIDSRLSDTETRLDELGFNGGNIIKFHYYANDEEKEQGQMRVIDIGYIAKLGQIVYGYTRTEPIDSTILEKDTTYITIEKNGENVEKLFEPINKDENTYIYIELNFLGNNKTNLRCLCDIGINKYTHLIHIYIKSINYGFNTFVPKRIPFSYALDQKYKPD